MKSLNARLTLSAGAVLAVFIALSGFALERAFRDSARSARQERLLAQVYLVMAAAEVDAKGTLTIGEMPMDPRLDLPGSGLYAAISDSRGRAVWRSRSALTVNAPYMSDLAAGSQRFDEIPIADGRVFLVEGYGVSWKTSAGSYPFTFSVAEDLAPFREQLNVYRRSLFGWLGAMALLLLSAQWITLRWGLAPLRQVTAELKQLEDGRREKITGDYPAEISLLTDGLNSVLAHERAQQKRYRDALADLAHSLKTPLALMRGAMDEARPDPALARTLDEQVAHMDRIVGYHLQRASASGRSGLAMAIALRPVVQRMLTALSKVHSQKSVETEVAIEPALRFRGDEGDLTEMLGNVLDNAFKWCRGRVRIGAILVGGRLTLTVEDDGPGIGEADAGRVLQRGVRANQTVPGHGIGLAVTRDIVEAYDGRIDIGRSPLGGAVVTLSLPGNS